MGQACAQLCGRGDEARQPLLDSQQGWMSAPKKTAKSWTEAVLSHVKDAETQAAMRSFLESECAQQIITDWAMKSEDTDELAQTDMCDVYKVSMMGAFYHIQKRYDEKYGKNTFSVSFSLNVRKSSELSLEEIFSSKATLRDLWLKTMFRLTSRKFDMQVLKGLADALPPPLKGVIRVPEELLQELEGNPQGQAVSLKVYLKPNMAMKKDWMEILPAASGSWEVKAPDGKVQGLEAALKQLGAPQNYHVVVNIDGPWHLVTFFETSLMQTTAEVLGAEMARARGWEQEKFYAEALGQLARRMAIFKNEFSTGEPFDVFLFAGRRSTKLGFHLLQNLWCISGLQNYKGTSSLFAYRAFRNYGWIDVNGAGKHPELQGRVMSMVGTHAHEGSMVFSSICSDADDEFEFPISSLIWHMNYWLLTGNQAALPDTMGTPAFTYLLETLQFPAKFTEEWNKRHGPVRKMKGGIPIIDELRDPSIGGLIRQDSGQTSAYPSTYFPQPIRLKIVDGKPFWYSPETGEASQGFKCFASEIGKDEDVLSSRKQGFMGIGTGGYLGEKPWEVAGSVGADGKKLNHKIDLVAKVGKVTIPGKDTAFYPVKLGDYKEPGAWHAEVPGKFALSPECQEVDEGPDAPDEEVILFARSQRLGEVPCKGPAVPERAKRLYNLANYPEEKVKPKRFDEDAAWRQRRFEEFWDEYCFV